MSRRKKDPLRTLTEEERTRLEQISRAQSEPASHVAHAKALLCLAKSGTYTAAAQVCGRSSGDAVSHLAARFNKEGLAALQLQHGGGPKVVYGVQERERILTEAKRPLIGNKTGQQPGHSRRSVRRCVKPRMDSPISAPSPSGRPCAMPAGAGRRPALCETGKVKRKRKAGMVEVTDPDTAEKNLIEQAYQQGESLDLAVWCTDQAGPFQTVPQAGKSWEPEGQPKKQPSEYIRNGTAKLLTLFHPADSQVRVKGVTSCPNVVLHPWLKEAHSP